MPVFQSPPAGCPLLITVSRSAGKPICRRCLVKAQGLQREHTVFASWLSVGLRRPTQSSRKDPSVSSNANLSWGSLSELEADSHPTVNYSAVRSVVSLCCYSRRAGSFSGACWRFSCATSSAQGTSWSPRARWPCPSMPRSNSLSGGWFCCLLFYFWHSNRHFCLLSIASKALILILNYRPVVGSYRFRLVIFSGRSGCRCRYSSGICQRWNRRSSPRSTRRPG